MSWVDNFFFQSNHHDQVEKIQYNRTQLIIGVQPNPTHINQVGPIGWTIFFFSNWALEQ